jgi:hypothetical protein
MLLLAGAAEAGGAVNTRRASAPASTHRTRAVPGRPDRLVAGDPAHIALGLAERYWGAVPCGGQITVRADQPLAAGMDATTDAWATFQSSLGANDLQAPAATYSDCTISLARWQWPTRSRQAADWDMFCLTVVHEMGHLLGQPHSLAPGSVMAAVFVDEANVPPVCRAARPPTQTNAG